MPAVEEDLAVQCPFCFETIFVRVDCLAGAQQSFTYDCEVCCRPIVLDVQVDTRGNWSVSAGRE